MQTTADDRRDTGPRREPHEGLVVAVHRDPSSEQVEIQSEACGRVRVRSAVVGYRPAEGDRVLLVGRYIVGVLLTATPTQREIGLFDAEGRRVATWAPDAGRLTLDGGAELALRGRRVTLEADEAVRICGPELELESERLEADVGVARWSASRWRVHAYRLETFARDAFVEVEGLYASRAATVRSIAEKTLELFGRRTSMRATEDAVVDGRRVRLG